jgi:hypothetical protein
LNPKYVAFDRSNLGYDCYKSAVSREKLVFLHCVADKAKLGGDYVWKRAL